MLEMRKAKGILQEIRNLQDMLQRPCIQRRNSRSQKGKLVGGKHDYD